MIRVILFAQESLATAGPAFWIDVISRLGVASVLGYLLWFFVVKQMPAAEARHEQERKEWREERHSWQAFMKDRDEQAAKRDQQIMTLMNSLAAQNEKILDRLEK